MDKEEVVKILRREELCVKTADSCGRDCGKCPLVMDAAKIVEAYETAIALLTIEPKKGNWVGIDDEPHDDWECDRCGEIVTDCGWDALPNFCPNCGADMRGEEG